MPVEDFSRLQPFEEAPNWCQVCGDFLCECEQTAPLRPRDRPMSEMQQSMERVLAQGDEALDFEAWLRAVCFQAPPEHCRDLAECAWKAALASRPAAPVAELVSAAYLACGDMGCYCDEPAEAGPPCTMCALEAAAKAVEKHKPEAGPSVEPADLAARIESYIPRGDGYNSEFAHDLAAAAEALRRQGGPSVVDEDAALWEMIAKAEAAGATKDEGEEGPFWTLDVPAFYALARQLSETQGTRLCLAFGHGKLVVNTGTYGTDKAPAVFIAPAAGESGKPSWKDAPEWAEWLAQDADGAWAWHEDEPEPTAYFLWSQAAGMQRAIWGTPNPNWRATLEPRPAGADGGAV